MKHIEKSDQLCLARMTLTLVTRLLGRRTCGSMVDPDRHTIGRLVVARGPSSGGHTWRTAVTCLFANVLDDAGDVEEALEELDDVAEERDIVGRLR